MTQPELDKEGFLKNLEDWTPEIARTIAGQDGIELTAEHFEVIEVARNFYTEFGLSPVNRVLVKAVRQTLGEDRGSSLYLLALFKQGPAKLVCKIAGLPKPNNCL